MRLILGAIILAERGESRRINEEHVARLFEIPGHFPLKRYVDTALKTRQEYAWNDRWKWASCTLGNARVFESNGPTIVPSSSSWIFSMISRGFSRGIRERIDPYRNVGQEEEGGNPWRIRKRERRMVSLDALAHAAKAGHRAAHGRAVETTGCLVQVFSDGVKPYVTPTVRS